MLIKFYKPLQNLILVIVAFKTYSVIVALEFKSGILLFLLGGVENGEEEYIGEEEIDVLEPIESLELSDSKIIGRFSFIKHVLISLKYNKNLL